jgi:hypothetical protein
LHWSTSWRSANRDPVLKDLFVCMEETNFQFSSRAINCLPRSALHSVGPASQMKTRALGVVKLGFLHRIFRWDRSGAGVTSLRGRHVAPQYQQIYYSIRAVPYNCPFCSLKLDWVQTTAWLNWRDKSRLQSTQDLAFESSAGWMRKEYEIYCISNSQKNWLIGVE